VVSEGTIAGSNYPGYGTGCHEDLKKLEWPGPWEPFSQVLA
jgi:hypothetical protein